MPISGLVITFEHSFPDQAETISQFHAHRAIEVGEQHGNKCAIVVESDSKEEDQKISQWVRNLPGVADVQIAFIGIEDRSQDQDN